MSQTETKPRSRLQVSMVDPVDVTPPLIAEPIILKRELWHIKRTERGFQPVHVKETWSPKPKFLPDNFLALVGCPKCGMPSALSKDIHEIDRLGKVTPSFICKFIVDGRVCNFNRTLYLDEWSKKPLYCCVVLERGKVEKYYVNAETQAEARVELGDGPYKVIAIGRAIALFVNDKKGEQLSTD